MTMTGEIVDISCYKSKGVAGGTGAAHVDCAKICMLEKGARSASSPTATACSGSGAPPPRTNTRRCMPYIGQQVEITGTEVTLSNNYDVRSFDLQTVKRKGK